jgi:hypothetical protein
MFKRIVRPGCALLMGAILTACGGGSGGPNTGGSSGGSSGGNNGGGTTNTDRTGVLLDAAVQGVAYSGSTGGSGTTNASGEFTVSNGATVTFRLGSIVLGTSEAVTVNGQVVTPAELAGDPTNFNNPVAVRQAQVLQTLDSDSDTSNGITIDPTVADRLDGTANATALADAIESGDDFDAVFGGMLPELTAGVSDLTADDVVSASVAKAELAAAVADDTGASASGPVGGEPIVPADTANCPVGVASVNKASVFGKDFPICVLTGDITSNVTLTNDHVYVLETAVNVGTGEVSGGGATGVTLTLEPGVQLFGYAGLQTGLVITRGSQIDAAGLPDLPIIMAAVEATGSGSSLAITDDPTDLTSRGQWAGLVLSGKGVNNQCTGGLTEIQSEAVATGAERYFGCDNNADSSGTVEYVIIAESGLGFRPDQEVQGLTIEAAGSGTTINYLQVLGSEDDGIEWFGGAANVSNVVINGADDDSLDFDEGHVGTVQKALVIQGAQNGDRGIEADNAGPSDNAEPVSRTTFINVTILGNQGGANQTMGALWKVGYGGAMWRSAILDYYGAPAGTGEFSLGCIDIDNQIDSNTAFRDLAWDCAAGLAVQDSDGLAESFIAGGDDETGTAVSADRRDFVQIDGATALNRVTLSVDAGQMPGQDVPASAAVNGVAIGNYFGAVDPSSGNPDQDPTNNGNGGGPFWDGWTYIDAAVDGGLPGAFFHPLEEEIRAGGAQ